jgi:tetratricopeptide (TPR) repeat protein
MKQSLRFFESLENYTWKVVMRFSPTLPWIGVGLVVMVISTSLFTAKSSLAGTSGRVEAAVVASSVGDYDVAQSLWEKQLPTESGEEDLIYPKRAVEREITKYQELLAKYPGHRDIYLVLAQLYVQIGEREQAQDYLEMARELDPNNAYFGQ